VPITLKALRATELGKDVKKLAKHADSQVAERSAALVDAWMKLLPTTEQKAGREGFELQLTNLEQAKKPKTDPTSKKRKSDSDSPVTEQAKPGLLYYVVAC
jgi:hypothetical protein